METVSELQHLLDARMLATAVITALLAALPWLMMHVVATRVMNSHVELLLRKRRLQEQEERQHVREIQAEVEPWDVDVRALAEIWQQCKAEQAHEREERQERQERQRRRETQQEQARRGGATSRGVSEGVTSLNHAVPSTVSGGAGGRLGERGQR